MTLKDLKKMLDTFKGKVDEQTNLLLTYKQEVERMKSEIYNLSNKGQYIRDNDRIVLSAPEIVIGNVNASGGLIGNGSKVIIRSNDIEIDATGEHGEIRCQAPSIRQRAIDTGPDGVEEKVQNVSQIVSQGRGIALLAQTTNNDATCKGTFVSSVVPPEGTVNLGASKAVNINAMTPGTKTKDDYDTAIQERADAITEKTEEVSNIEAGLNNIMQLVQDALDQQFDYQKDFISQRSHMQDLDNVTKTYNNYLPGTYSMLETYYKLISELAELKRQKKSLEKDRDKLVPNNANDYQTKSTEAAVNIKAEQVTVSSMDADGNLRTNQGAGFYVRSNYFEVNAYQKDNATLMPYSEVRFDAQNITFSTANIVEVNDTATKKDRTYNPVGNVNVNSKFVTIQSYKNHDTATYSTEGANTKIEKTSEPQGYPDAPDKLPGVLNLKSQYILLDAVDKDQKADGTISLNGKNLELTSIDNKLADNEAQAATKDSSVMVYSDKVFLGSIKDKSEATLIQTKSKSLTLFATETAAVQSKDDTLLQLSDGKADVSAKSGITIYGKTTVKADADFESNVNVKSGVVTAKGVTANSGLKGPKYNDSQPQAPASSNSETASAKLKEEQPEKKKIE